MKYEDIELGREVRVVAGKGKGKTGKVTDFWPPVAPSVMLDSGGEYSIADVELIKND